MEDLILKLKMQRMHKNISISEVARRMGTSQPTLSRIESGKIGLTLKMLYRYAEAIGVKVTIKFE